jgi:hypothetical protein
MIESNGMGRMSAKENWGVQAQLVEARISLAYDRRGAGTV